MQFINNGPDIPDALLRAHEDGKVIFFCGAGISIPAGLPNFQKLVDEVYTHTDTSHSDAEKAAYDNELYDATLNLLEKRLPDGRNKLRQAIFAILSRKSWSKKETETHRALLELSKTPDGKYRLVTTNFDRLFESAAKYLKSNFESFSAPMLPIPKKSRWNGLVYLHGLLTPDMTDADLNRLVVTSGDFGQAYLTERWASRFVSELFRNYQVCFIGYGINDPVMRYMMDALAADKLAGETTQQTWAFGGFIKGEEEQEKAIWQSKGVSPIMFEIIDKHDYSLLYKTINDWAATYRDGITGKERIITEYATSYPANSTRQDDFIGRMLWALSDKSGLPAKLFANHIPAPDLDWLFNALMQERYTSEDLGTSTGSPSPHEKLKFSMISRPSPNYHVMKMSVLSESPMGNDWDDIMCHLADWLLRYLNDTRLLIAVANSYGCLHNQLKNRILLKLSAYAKCTTLGNTEELNKIKKDSPEAIPGYLMKTLWELVICGRVKPKGAVNIYLYQWMARLTHGGISFPMRLELKELLAPKLFLSETSYISSLTNDNVKSEPTKVGELVHFELVLNSEHARTVLDYSHNILLRSALPMLLEDFEDLLRDAMNLLKAIGEADDNSDRSFLSLPSISEHNQNRRFRAWVLLIDLVRDAWLEIYKKDFNRAKRVACRWFEESFPVFKRLAFFAARHDGIVKSDQWVEWLTGVNSKWLWSTETEREVYRLLVLQGRNLSPSASVVLENAILNGPPRCLYREDITDETLKQLYDREIWLTLAKLELSGHALGYRAMLRLKTLSKKNPHWKLAENERDEFAIWMGDGLSSDFKSDRSTEVAPETFEGMVAWLRKDPTKNHPFADDEWKDRCTSNLILSIRALEKLAKENFIPTERWVEAFQAWSADKLKTQSWENAAPVVYRLPDDKIEEMVHHVSRWIAVCANTTSKHRKIFTTLCSRILAMPIPAESDITVDDKPIDDPVVEAINHPVGHIADALIGDIFRNEIDDNDKIPRRLRPVFSEIFNTELNRFRHARVILATNLNGLFRIDPEWTQKNLLPCFSWNNPSEARALWSGFLLTARLHKPLFIIIKHDFLSTAGFYSSLGEQKNHYVSLLTYAALEMGEEFTETDLRDAFRKLPTEGLEDVCMTLINALEGAGEQGQSYWRNRIRPFWKKFWPKFEDRKTPSVSEKLVRLVLMSGYEFQSAYTLLKDWFLPLAYLQYSIDSLKKNKLYRMYPLESLFLLDKIIDCQSHVPYGLNEILTEIEDTNPDLGNSSPYKRIRNFINLRSA
ncbi:anti-phage defense-associated sirtuin Dsr1 [Pantoea ananatis]|uniref:anti-phage defense-associated sirtuin Dsr1 n=1 Tax=Pantoea ananas TaxID=553 RepID=UPI001B301613|nr:anti-phage defense-associated sirtuin Dsr1 [Pantoea ananatis]